MAKVVGRRIELLGSIAEMGAVPLGLARGGSFSRDPKQLQLPVSRKRVGSVKDQRRSETLAPAPAPPRAVMSCGHSYLDSSKSSDKAV
jgi:hypothetical protein